MILSLRFLDFWLDVQYSLRIYSYPGLHFTTAKIYFVKNFNFCVKFLALSILHFFRKVRSFTTRSLVNSSLPRWFVHLVMNHLIL